MLDTRDDRGDVQVDFSKDGLVDEHHLSGAPWWMLLSYIQDVREMKMESRTVHSLSSQNVALCR